MAQAKNVNTQKFVETYLQRIWNNTIQLTEQKKTTNSGIFKYLIAINEHTRNETSFPGTKLSVLPEETRLALKNAVGLLLINYADHLETLIPAQPATKEQLDAFFKQQLVLVNDTYESEQTTSKSQSEGDQQE